MAERNSNHRPANFQDITGQRFGKWTAITQGKPRYWLCRCDCGNEKEVHRGNLLSGKTGGCHQCRFGTVEDRLRNGKIEISGKCWLWMGKRIMAGYGVILEKGNKQTYVHRLMYKLVFGIDPGGMLVCHRCDNPPCCNPAHLFLGTNADNLRDMWKKGRGKSPVFKGEAHPNAVLTEDTVRAIRHDSSVNGLGYAALKNKYGSCVGNIIYSSSWSHVK